MNCNLTRRAILIAVLLFFGLQWQTPGTFAQAPFYEGKTITVLQGREPGGTGDLRARAVTQFLQKYIPGNPTIIHEFMAGGGGLRAVYGRQGSLWATPGLTDT
jgi:tripartite-type tricarboxylate transporter receptor subunit TctC